MTSIKSFFASKTVWGAIIAILPNVAAIVGLNIAPGDAAAVGGHVQEIAAAVGGLIAIWGRVTATKRIGGAGR